MSEKGEQADLIENNTNQVEAIIQIVRTLIQSGVSWDKIREMVSESKKGGDELANLIHELDLEHDRVQILLPGGGD